MGKPILNVKKRSIALLFLSAVIVPAIVSVAGLFDFADLSNEAVQLATLLTGAFIISEIGLVGMFKTARIRKDPLRFFGLIVGLLVIVSGGLGLLGMSFKYLNVLQGTLGVFAIVYAISEGIRD